MRHLFREAETSAIPKARLAPMPKAREIEVKLPETEGSVSQLEMAGCKLRREGPANKRIFYPLRVEPENKPTTITHTAHS